MYMIRKFFEILKLYYIKIIKENKILMGGMLDIYRIASNINKVPYFIVMKLLMI